MKVDKQLKQTSNNTVSKDVSLYIKTSENSSEYLKSEFFETSKLDNTNQQRAQELQNHITLRKSQMVSAKSGFSTNLILWDNIWEANTVIEYNGNPLFNVPLEKAIVKVFESEVGERDIVYNIKPEGESTNVDKIKPNQIVMDHYYYKDRTSEKAVDFRKDFGKYGFSVMFEGLETSTKKIRGDQSKDFISGNSLLNADTKEETTLITEFLLGSRNVPVKNFLIDDGVVDFNKAIDCIELEFLSKQEVKSKYNGKNFFNLEKVIGGLKDLENEVVHYFNKLEDIYSILINDIIIYEGPNPYPHKELPYTVAIMDKSKKTAYGEGGFIHLLQFAVPFVNNLMNTTIKQTNLSNLPPILMGENAEFDGGEPVFDTGEIWHISGPLSEVRELKISPPDSSIFNVREAIYDFIVQVTGIDLRQIYSKTEKTKFEAGLMEQAKNKRLGTYERTLNYSYQRLLNQRLKNVHYFLGIIEASQVIDPELQKAGFKKILVDNKIITTNESGNLNVQDVPGAYSEFVMNPESIRGDFSVRIITESTKPMFPELRKSELTEQLIPNLLTIGKLFPDAITKINGTNLVKELFGTFNIDIDNLVPHTYSKQLEEKNKEFDSKLADFLSPTTPTETTTQVNEEIVKSGINPATSGVSNINLQDLQGLIK